MPITQPTEADITQLAKQRLLADELISKHGSGSALDESLSDIERIQAVLDTGELGSDMGYELQCLGIAFGRVMAKNVNGLDWAIIESGKGRDLAMRFEDTKLCFPIRTILSQRVEAGEDIDLKAIYDQLVDKLAELKEG